MLGELNPFLSFIEYSIRNENDDFNSKAFAQVLLKYNNSSFNIIL